ncbi:MAG: response regulator [Deltaproteobacteria bacterium]|jgi:signal transduction histidine kinase
MHDQPIKLLLVDDDEDDYVIIRNLLSEIDWANFELHWASTYKAAQHVVKSGRHQVILVDYRLGEHSGLEFLRWLRLEDSTTPVILLSAYGNHDLDMKAMEDGAADYLEKERLTAPVLKRSIRYALDREKNLALLRKSEMQLRLLSSKLIEAQEDERELIARELHDSIGASLTAIIYALEEAIDSVSDEQAIQLKEVLSMAQETVEETRRISSNLRPSILDDLGILATINWFFRQFEGLYDSIKIEKHIEVREDEVAAPLKIAIYRIIQEALNNAAKHSEADTVRVSLRRTEERLELTIADNGIGLDAATLFHQGEPGTGMGLDGMKERTEFLGGSFTIRSKREEGTVVKASWPLSLSYPP